jgi:hypothetical protein
MSRVPNIIFQGEKMNNNNVKLDMENLKKLAPVSLAIGAGLGVLAATDIYFGGLWGLILLVAWAFCGCFYSNTLLKAGSSSEFSNLALNGAILAALAEVVYVLLLGILSSLRTDSYPSFFSLSLFLEAGIVGALAAVAWKVYKTSKKPDA